MQDLQVGKQRRSICFAAVLSAVFGFTAVIATNPLIPDNGAWVGVSIDWSTWASVNDYIQQAEFQPSSFTIFIR